MGATGATEPQEPQEPREPEPRESWPLRPSRIPINTRTSCNDENWTRFLSKEEKQIFIDILFKFEGAIAVDGSEMGLSNEPPVVLHTIPHVP